jgi:hypothetical protein
VPTVVVQIDATGVVIRLASVDESRAMARGGDLSALAGGGGFDFVGPTVGPSAFEAEVVLRPFVEFHRDGRAERWDGAAHYGLPVPTNRDATSELLAVAREADLIALLADMRIEGFGVSRWEFLSAPHRIELDPSSTSA